MEKLQIHAYKHGHEYLKNICFLLGFSIDRY